MVQYFDLSLILVIYYFMATEITLYSKEIYYYLDDNISGDLHYLYVSIYSTTIVTMLW